MNVNYQVNLANDNQNIIPAHPIPLMPLQQQIDFDNFIDMLIQRIDRVRIRSALLTLIDCSIIYDNMNNNERIQVNNVVNAARNNILDENSQGLINSIMNIVYHATVEQRIHMFDRIAMLFRHNQMAG
jgi:hypothetical protein